MLFVLIVGFRILAFIVLLIKSTPISTCCCSKNRSKNKSTDEKKWIKNITFKDGFIVVEKSIVVEIKNDKPEKNSGLVPDEHSKL
jgi:hypothetical protein